jgi:hypothetical protein
MYAGDIEHRGVEYYLERRVDTCLKNLKTGRN